MELSIFLARFLGIFYLLFLGIWALRKEEVDRLIQGIFSNRELLGLSGFMTLMFGVAIVVGHSVWELNWRGLITLMGYLAVLQGIVRIAYQEFPQKMVSKLLKGIPQKVIFLVLFIMGSFLTYSGFIPK